MNISWIRRLLRRRYKLMSALLHVTEESRAAKMRTDMLDIRCSTRSVSSSTGQICINAKNKHSEITLNERLQLQSHISWKSHLMSHAYLCCNYDLYILYRGLRLLQRLNLYIVKHLTGQFYVICINVLYTVNS